MLAAADDEALQALLTHGQTGGRDGAGRASQDTDQRDMTATRAAWMDWASVPWPPTSTT
jgi:hypothetical protein